MRERKVLVKVWLPKELHKRAIEHLIERYGNPARKFSGLVREALEAYLDESGREG